MCNNPLLAWKSKTVDPVTRKRGTTLHWQEALDPKMSFLVPCYNKCRACLYARAQDWGIKGACELHMMKVGDFLNLSYAPKYLPKNNTLVRKHIQDFNKRLRKFAKQNGTEEYLRILYCGEYGELKGRAHYHLVVFGHQFGNQYDEKGSNGNQKYPIYRSKDLDQLWPYGKSWIGTVTFDSVQYLSKYTVKKVSGKFAEEFYGKRGQIPPFIQGPSKGGALGIPYLEKYKNDIYPRDSVKIDGREMKPPRSFDDWLEKTDPAMFKTIKTNRVQQAEKHRKEHPEEYTPLRLAQKEEYLEYTNREKDDRS